MRHLKIRQNYFLVIPLLVVAMVSVTREVQADDTLDPLSWGNRNNEDFSEWTVNSPVKNTVTYRDGRDDVWKSTTSPLEYTQYGEIEYSFSEAQSRVEMRVEVQYSFNDLTDDAFWYISVLDIEGNEYRVMGFKDDVYSHEGLNSCIGFFHNEGGGYQTDYGEGMAKWHTLAIEIDPESYHLSWDITNYLYSSSDGVAMEKIRVVTWKTDLYIASWKLSGNAHRIDETGQLGNFLNLFFGIGIGVAVTITFRELIRRIVSRKKTRKASGSFAPHKAPTGQEIECPNCHTNRERGEQFCSTCGTSFGDVQ